MIHCPSLPHTANPGSAAKYPLMHLKVAVLCVCDGVALYVTIKSVSLMDCSQKPVTKSYITVHAFQK